MFLNNNQDTQKTAHPFLTCTTPTQTSLHISFEENQYFVVYKNLKIFVKFLLWLEKTLPDININISRVNSYFGKSRSLKIKF